MSPLTSLALVLGLISLSLPSASAIFPFVLQCAVAPWPVRSQPAWQTTTRSITDTTNNQIYRPGSMILYGGVGSNDSQPREAHARTTAEKERNPRRAPLLTSASSPSPLCVSISLDHSARCGCGSSVESDWRHRA